MLSIHHASRLIPSTEQGRERLNLNAKNPSFFYTNNTNTFLRGFYRYMLPFCGNASVVGNKATS